MTENVNAIKLVFDQIVKSKTPEQVLENIQKIRKYDENIIAVIYSWIFEKLGKKKRTPSSLTGYRIVSSEEVSLIGIENYSYILHFFNLGLINSEEIDKLINQLELMPEALINTKLINILLITMFIYGDAAILPGSRLHLYSSDTIN
ncbi:MAG: hypothetical protein Q8903_02465 [Bacteroidota bacterium]|nr:hypothetical protein [Bacteroidota bacterium]